LDTHKTAWSREWFIDDPSTFPTSDSTQLAMFIVPAGVSIDHTKIKAVFWSGSHTSGGDITITIVRRTSAGGSPTVIATIHLDNTNNTLGQVYSAAAAGSLTEDQQLCVQITRSGTISERRVTVALHGTQKFTT
jgi:hypothetical protein